VNDVSEQLSGRRVSLVGKLAGMSRRDAAQLVRSRGAAVVDPPDQSTNLLVVGEDALPSADALGQDSLLDETLRQAIDRGEVEVISETQLWERLGLVEARHEAHPLYTPAMLAELLHVPVAVVRRWHRRGLIVPVREVRRLPYFDFQEVSTARRLAELLAAGVSPRTIERRLAELARWLPNVARPLAQLSVIVSGKEILLRQGDGLVEPGGQLRLDFDAWPAAPPPQTSPPASAEQMRRLAAELEDDGQLSAAAEMYRAAMAAEGPKPELCFQLAELLYRQGDLNAARERYYMALELDEDYVEARANLGCVLAESGQKELAVAAFEGALRSLPDYADARYHLARTLDELDRREEAAAHWRAFLAAAPDSPWADEARARLAQM
jgi:tetratricopeptide (TPR) repeat protein